MQDEYISERPTTPMILPKGVPFGITLGEIRSLRKHKARKQKV